MSEHRMRWSREHSTSPEPESPGPKDTRPWDPDEDPAVKPTDGGNPAASKNKKKPFGEWPIGVGG